MLWRKTSLILVSSLCLGVSLISPVSALDIQVVEEKEVNIRGNCDSIKQSIKRVQNSDRNTRVSLGRSYQQIISDFVTPLNVRLVKNNRFDANLNEIQKDLVSTRESFNQNYVNYSQALENLLAIDCKNNPNDFYAKLITVRESRAKVAESTKEMNELIKKHADSVKSLRASFNSYEIPVEMPEGAENV